MPQGQKTNVRVSGYAITIHGFIPIPKDRKEQIAALTAIDAAIESGDPLKLVAMMELDADGINQKNINRMIPEDEWATMQKRRAAAASKVDAATAEDNKLVAAAKATKANQDRKAEGKQPE